MTAPVDLMAALRQSIDAAIAARVVRQREAIVATIAASEALKPAGQRLINRIPGLEDVECPDADL